MSTSFLFDNFPEKIISFKGSWTVLGNLERIWSEAWQRRHSERDAAYKEIGASNLQYKCQHNECTDVVGGDWGSCRHHYTRAYVHFSTFYCVMVLCKHLVLKWLFLCLMVELFVSVDTDMYLVPFQKCSRYCSRNSNNFPFRKPLVNFVYSKYGGR